MAAVDILIRLVVAVVATWLVLLALLALSRPRGVDLAEAKRFLPDLVRLVKDLAGDPSLGRGVRARLLLLSAYLVSPVDLVPDFVPVLGYADDVVVVAVVLRSVVRRAGPAVLEEHWGGTQVGLASLRRLAGLDTAPRDRRTRRRG